MKDKKWEILSQGESGKGKPLSLEKIITILLANRNVKTKKEIANFLHASLSSVTPKSVGIDESQLRKAVKRIQQAIQNNEDIVVFGDYDVDGIAGSAILWETLHALGAKATPYIPSRIEEGYGLSVKGISNIIKSDVISSKSERSQSKNRDSSLSVQNDKKILIVTVDNGIVANEAVKYANENSIDVIITDHHTPPAGGREKLPDAYAIVHTTAVCGAGVAWLLSQAISSQFSVLNSQQSVGQLSVTQSDKLKTDQPKSENRQQRTDNRIPNDHLSLVALATVADLVPLTGTNRVLLRLGLSQLQNTKRPGLLALFAEAKMEPKTIGVYEIGHMIAPRLNAMGRLESAMDSLRLLCTKDRLRAKVLADKLGRTNRERQQKTFEAAEHAILAIRQQAIGSSKKLLFIAHEQYEEGIIGLVAGKLVEEFYLPAIVVSKGEKISKASARSIAGFNIIEFIRSNSDLLINAGGHPMAAGFTIDTEKITLLQEKLEKLVQTTLKDDLLTRVLKIDMRLSVENITVALYTALQNLGPFGMGNPQPLFVSNVIIKEVKTVGKENTHLKLTVSPTVIPAKAGIHGSPIRSGMTLDAIGFNLGYKAKELKPGTKVDIVYTIDENEWQGKASLQLKIKDIKT